MQDDPNYDEAMSHLDPPDPPEPNFDETWTIYKIWDNADQADSNVTIFCTTNDDLDTGHPGKYANWILNYDNLKSAVKHTGITRAGPGHDVYVELNGRPLRTKDLELHQFISDLMRIKYAFDREFDKAEATNDAVGLLAAMDIKNLALEEIIKEREELLDRLIEEGVDDENNEG